MVQGSVANIYKLQQFLDLKWHQTEADLDLMLYELIDPAARHDDPKHYEANQPLVRSLHKLVLVRLMIMRRVVRSPL